MNGKEVIRRLEMEDWQLVRVNGSHFRFKKGSRCTSVPVHGHRDLGIGLLKAIEKQTGVKLL